MKLLIDENLSPLLAQWANQAGFPSQAVRDAGLMGQPDIRVWQYAWRYDQVVVTLNIGDFLNLARSIELHPGVIALREAGLSREDQWQRLCQALEWADDRRGGDLVNKVLEVRGDGDLELHDVP